MKKGISMISLSISLIVILVFTSAVVISSKPIIENSNRTKFVAEILLLEDGIDSYKLKNGVYPENGVITLNLGNVTSDALVQFDGETIQDDKVQLYLIDFEKISIEDKEFGNNEDGQNLDVYAFSKQTDRVYYIKGIKYQGNTYYTLTDTLYNNTRMNNLKYNEIKKGDCIFVRKVDQSIVKANRYVSDIVNVDIYVPKDAENISISYLGYTGNEPSSSLVTSDKEGYVKYETLCNNATNYTIVVEYVKNNVSQKAEYVEDKVDAVAPSIDLTNRQIVSLTAEGQTKSYLIVYNILDNESGIKLKKYELGNMPID